MNKIKILMILFVSIAFTSTALTVHAQQISPNPNEGTITVSSMDAYNGGGVFRNLGLIDILNTGILTNDGELWTYGRINNGGELINNNGLLQIEGGGVINGGTLTNNYQVEIRGGSLDNWGVLNSGMDPSNHLNALLANMNTLRNMGTLNNGGLLDNRNGILNQGTLNNRGRLENSGSSLLQNEGTLNNRGHLGNAAMLVNTGSGVLNNEGLLGNGGRLDNLGTLNNRGELMNTSGQLDNRGTLNNSGRLFNATTISGPGHYIQTAGVTQNAGSMSQSTIEIRGGVLTGTGSITGDVTIGPDGSLEPGNSPGTLTINGDLYSSGTVILEIGGFGAGEYDILDVNGNAYFTGGTIMFNFINDFDPSAGSYWDFLLADNINGWDTLAFNFEGLDAGYDWTFNGGRLMIEETGGTSVPEPATFLLLGLGLLGLAGARRKIKK